MVLNREIDVDCKQPILIKDNNNFYRYVPCGHCPICLNHKKKDWSTRLQLEASCHFYNCFGTLTYADNIVKLDYRDVQLFLKRLRKCVNFKYFVVGEYGAITHRPHWHFIFFGIGAGNIRDILQENWSFGFVQVSPLNSRRVNYTVGYCLKKINDDSFSRMSKGLGKQYLLDHLIEIKRNCFISCNGYRFGLPRYYVKCLRSMDPDWYDLFISSVNKIGLSDDPILNNYMVEHVLGSKQLKSRTIEHKFNLLRSEKL